MAAISLAALLGLSASVTEAGPKPKLTAPSIGCSTNTQNTITLAITGTGEFGAPSGFSLHWTTCDNLAANDGEWDQEADGFCSASFSGNANGAYFNLSPSETVLVTIGDLGNDWRPGVSWTCDDDLLACGTCYVFRAFAHGDNSYSKSDWSADQVCTTADCGDTDCGTGFAKGSAAVTSVFYDGAGNPSPSLPYLSAGNGRWGWALHVPAGDGTTTADLWVGAGQNDTANGTLVGTVTITVDGEDVTVEYDLDGGYSLDAVHVYASDDQPVANHGPTGDVDSPGQYGYTEEDPDSDGHTAQFTVADTGGDGLWIIAHAVVCGVPVGDAGDE